MKRMSLVSVIGVPVLVLIWTVTLVQLPDQTLIPSNYFQCNPANPPGGTTGDADCDGVPNATDNDVCNPNRCFQPPDATPTPIPSPINTPLPPTVTIEPDIPTCRVYTDKSKAETNNASIVRKEPESEIFETLPTLEPGNDVARVFHFASPNHNSSAEFLEFSENGQWVKVRLDSTLNTPIGAVGWMFRDYLRIDPEGETGDVLIGTGCDVCERLSQNPDLVEVLSHLCPSAENDAPSRLTAVFVLTSATYGTDVFALIGKTIRQVTFTPTIVERYPTALPDRNLVAYVIEGTGGVQLGITNISTQSTSLSEGAIGGYDTNIFSDPEISLQNEKILWSQSFLYFTSDASIIQRIRIDTTQVTLAALEPLLEQGIVRSVDAQTSGAPAILYEDLNRSSIFIKTPNGQNYPMFPLAQPACTFPTFSVYQDEVWTFAQCGTSVMGESTTLQTMTVEGLRNAARNLNGGLNNGYLSYEAGGRLYWIELESGKTYPMDLGLPLGWSISDFTPYP